MYAVSLGYVTVPTPGTPVPLGPILAAKNFKADVVPSGKCHHIDFRALTVNTGNAYVGLHTTAPGSGGVTMNFTSGLNVLAQITKTPTTGQIDQFSLNGDGAGNNLNVADYSVDAGQGTTEGVSVTLWIA